MQMSFDYPFHKRPYFSNHPTGLLRCHHHGSHLDNFWHHLKSERQCLFAALNKVVHEKDTAKQPILQTAAPSFLGLLPALLHASSK